MKKENLLFKKINSKTEAVKVIEHLYYFFSVIGVLQIIFGAVSNMYIIVVVGIIYCVLTYLVHNYKNKISAICLLILSTVVLIFSITSFFIPQLQGNIVAAVLLVYASIRMVQAINVYNNVKSINISV